MFKKYLRVQPTGVQFVLFLTLWVAFSFIFSSLQPFLYQAYGLQVKPNEIILQEELMQHPGLIIWLNAIGAIFLFLLPALLFSYLASPHPGRYLGLKKPAIQSQWMWIILMSLGLVVTITSIGGWIKELDLGEAAKELNKQREAIFNTYLSTSGFGDMLLNLLLLALLPAVSEELFFRGVVQKFAYSMTKNPLYSILISGLAFALLHYSIYEFVPILLAGIVLAWVYYITSSLYLNILLHFLHNGIQVVLAFWAVRNPAFEHLEQNSLAMALISVLGMAVLAFCIWKLMQLKSPLPKDWGVHQSVDLNNSI